jgi:membrane associated rhomboid family serine protease
MSLTLLLIASTSVISLVAFRFRESIWDRLMLRPYRVLRQQTYYELLTSGFVHGSNWHLLTNMVVLLFFGVTVEQAVGAGHFLGLYGSGLVVSALPSMIRYGQQPTYATLGASGAVEAVLFTFIFFFPTDKLILFIFPIGIPAWIFGVGFLVYSWVSASRKGGLINHEAHIAGALWGWVYPLVFIPRSWDHLWTLIEQVL